MIFFFTSYITFSHYPFLHATVPFFSLSPLSHSLPFLLCKTLSFNLASIQWPISLSSPNLPHFPCLLHYTAQYLPHLSSLILPSLLYLPFPHATLLYLSFFLNIHSFRSLRALFTFCNPISTHLTFTLLLFSAPVFSITNSSLKLTLILLIRPFPFNYTLSLSPSYCFPFKIHVCKIFLLILYGMKSYLVFIDKGKS